METVSQNDAVQNAQSDQLHGEAQRLITDEAEFTLIPLNRLVKSPFNQRKKERPQAAVVSLAVNIRGLKRLLQNNRNLSSCYTATTASIRSAGSRISRHAGLH